MEYRTLKAKACIKRKTFYHVAITKFKMKPTNFKITLKKKKRSITITCYIYLNYYFLQTQRKSQKFANT